MKNLAKKYLILFVVPVFLGCLSISWAASVSSDSAKPPQIGNIKKIQGQAKLMRSGTASAQTASTGESVRVLDRLETLPGSKAWWSLRPASTDQNDASLGENSQLEFSGYERRQGGSFFALEISTGIVRLIKVLPKTSPESTFMAITATTLAWIETPGYAADFVVESLTPDVTVITVIRGAVRVKNISESLHTVRNLQACDTVTIQRDTEASEVRRASSSLLRSLVERTTIPGTFPENVPSCERMTLASPTASPEPSTTSPRGTKPPEGSAGMTLPGGSGSITPPGVSQLPGGGGVVTGPGGSQLPGGGGVVTGPGGSQLPGGGGVVTGPGGSQLPGGGGSVTPPGGSTGTPPDITGKLQEAIKSSGVEAPPTSPDWYPWTYNPKECSPSLFGCICEIPGLGKVVLDCDYIDKILPPGIQVRCRHDGKQILQCWPVACPPCPPGEIPIGNNCECQKSPCGPC